MKVLFIVSYPEFQAERGRSFKNIRKAAGELFCESELNDISCLIVTKCDADNSEDLIEDIERLAGIDLILPWAKNGRIGIFPKPEDGKINLGLKQPMLDIIDDLSSKKLCINPNKLFDQLDTYKIEEYYTFEIKGIISEYINTSYSGLNLLDLNKLKEKLNFCKQNFLKELNTYFEKSQILNLMKMVTDEIYQSSIKKINFLKNQESITKEIAILIKEMEKKIEEENRKLAEKQVKEEEENEKRLSWK